MEVHKPLLAVFGLVENGLVVNINKDKLHILRATGVTVLLECNMGTYEVEVYIHNSGFAGPRSIVERRS